MFVIDKNDMIGTRQIFIEHNVNRDESDDLPSNGDPL